MFKKYGLLGLFMILLGEIFIFFHSTIGNYLFFSFLWYGYILLVDSIVYKINKRSLIMNERKKFFTLIILSIIVWWIFEFFNIYLKNWAYVNILKPEWITLSIAFSVVIPAVFESFYLIKSIHILNHLELKKKLRITKKFLFSMLSLGILSIFLIFSFPEYFFPLTWVSLFLIIDPINYLHNQPSIIGYFRKGKLTVPISLMIGSLLTGFFWEFWNYWAPVKWYYNIPFISNLKLFEMPLLGYLGYLPFGWELFSMYNFIGTLYNERKILIKHRKPFKL